MESSYIRKKKIGEGTYATIFLCDEYLHNDTTKEKMIKEPTGLFKGVVAIKRIKVTRDMEGIHLSAVREIKSLKLIKHDFLISMCDVFQFDGSIHLVLEYCPNTLEDILKNREIIIMPNDIKAWLVMILKGLNEIHSNFMVHRDIKPNNILITHDGILKLADFGLCRAVSNQKMTAQAITRWYRPPELLLGCNNYSFHVDLWSVGCVMAEMFIRIPLFAAETDLKQLDLIFKALGTPEDSYFEEVSKDLPITFQKYPKSDYERLFAAGGNDCIDLINKLISYKPTLRPSPIECLKHSFFQSKPLPTPFKSLIKPPSVDISRANKTII